MIRTRLLAATICTLILSIAPIRALAIDVDEFDGTKFVTPTGTPTGTTLQVGEALATSINGNRSIQATAISNPASPLRVVLGPFGSQMTHSQDTGIAGDSLLIWDGDQNDSVNYPGLGGIDFTQDLSTQFQLRVTSFDHPADVKLTIIVYSTPTNASSLTVILDKPISNGSPQIIPFPFASFIKSPGALFGANFQSVSAITLEIDGTNAPDADLALDWLRTDQCTRFPDENKRVVDVCGVCGGDGTSCLGCDKIPNSGLVVDQCNVCGGNGTSCLDCNGTPFGTLKFDRCEVCGGNGTSCLGCVTEDLSPKQTVLDGGAIKQDYLIRSIIRHFAPKSPDKKTKKYIAVTLDTALTLHLQNWTLAWTKLPNQLETCSNSTLCATFSNQPALDEYRGRSEQLRQLAHKVVAHFFPKGKKLPKQALDALKQADNLHKQNLQHSFEIPTTYNSCG